MTATYFILTTASITQGQKDSCVGDIENQRKNNDGTKTVLEISNFNVGDTECSFYGETPYTKDEVLFELRVAEWQGE